MASRVPVFVATSVDGFLAGLDNDMSWLPKPGPQNDLGWGAFIAGIGCMLMGRGTYDVIVAAGAAWPHTDRDSVIAAHRPIADLPARVHPGEKDVCVDGGDLIRQALDAGLVDEVVVTQIPIVVGAGHPLFAGSGQRHPLKPVSVNEMGSDLLQVTYVPWEPAT